MEKKKCIIFGAGERGGNFYKKLAASFDVIAYADNNPKLWGARKNGVIIVPPEKLPALVRETGAEIFIANELHYLDIADQLDGLGLSYYNCEGRFCYEKEDGVWYPVSFGRVSAYRKPDKDAFAVLFVQDKPCTRTNKIAEALKNRGVLTYSAYVTSPSDAGSRAYIEEFPFWSCEDLLRFVNESDFDIIHCSNTPDILMDLLIHSGKKVIHDCHDIVSMQKRIVSFAESVMEYNVNTRADGVMYTTERMQEVMIRRYGTDPERTLVLGNYPLSSFGRVERLPKLSAKDGEIHCVYEGGIVDNTKSTSSAYRFYEPIFVQLAALGVHIHIYSPRVPEYLADLDRRYPTIHYEGNYSGHELIERMTQYDLGLLLFPKTDIAYLELCSPNKLTEYLSSGLPVVTNIKAYAQIIEKHSCGGALDLNEDDIVSKLLVYREISIAPDFCNTHGFTMDSNVERILAFYKKVIGK